ncbi:hypothetical protein DIPPA_18699 [Diplonema papillatum]|nr:hypothetical protein DIPPA_18699 [Diplonema papillatum]
MLGTDVCLSVMNEQSKSPSERYAFHEVTTGKDRQPLEDGSRLSFPPSSPSFGIPNSISNASAVDTMRIDLRKVAFRLCIPLRLLIGHFPLKGASGALHALLLYILASTLSSF